MAIIPARPRKPRDKAKVENAVLVVQRWIVACLRNRKFYSLDELNIAIAELLERLNDRPFKKLEGCGKSYLGAALAQAACRLGYRALYTRVPRLAHELTISRADGSYVNKLTNLAKLDVLVLDDFLIAPLKDTERRDLLEVLEDRYDRKSTVITSQVPTKKLA